MKQNNQLRYVLNKEPEVQPTDQIYFMTHYQLV